MVQSHVDEQLVPKVLPETSEQFFLEKYKTPFDINLAFAGSLPREMAPLTNIGRGGIGAL